MGRQAATGGFVGEFSRGDKKAEKPIDLLFSEVKGQSEFSKCERKPGLQTL